MRNVVAVFGGLLLAVMLVPVAGHSQCALDGCGTSICQGGCASSLPMIHPGEGMGSSGGRFGLAGTSYEATCNGLAAMGPCGAGTGRVPPTRFWAYNQFTLANNGCTDMISNLGLVHTVLDMGHGDDMGNWVLYGCNWKEEDSAGPRRIDGCIGETDPAPSGFTPRTVIEMSFADAQSGEGTPAHSSWYLVAAVPEAGGRYDFEDIKGGNSGGPGGDGPAHVVVRQPPSVRIDGLAGPTPRCPVNDFTMAGLPNPHSASHFNLEVRVNPDGPTARADWFTEAGRNKDPQLIEGYQVVYRMSATPPTSSYGWLPARDPSDPVHNLAGILPWHDAPGRITVALPKTPGDLKAWVAVRIVYRDGTLNTQLGPGPADTAVKLASLPGEMCGPVVSPITLAVEFAEVKAEWSDDGALISWSTLGELNTLGFVVLRATSPDGLSGLQEIGPPVMSRGAGSSYAAIDGQVSRLDGGSYWYYVQELTGDGYGTRSQWVELAVPTGPRAGGARDRDRSGQH